MADIETFYEVMRRQGITRRSFMKYCSLTASALGLGPAFVPRIAHAMETKPRTPVIWLNGLECTCCSESFIRSAHPLAKDVVLSMISLDYQHVLMAAAGHQAEAALEESIEKYRGNYILAVEGNPPLNEDGMFCINGGKPFVEQLRHVAKDAKAIISWGACASYGCVQAAKPNPTQATPVHKVITDKPIIKVPGCPPIAEVMTGVITYMLTFDRLPELDRQGRPKMFYSQRIHDKCYRRPHFDAGQFIENWDDEYARKGYCLYKMGCKGPTTYNACSTVGWNGGTSFPDPVGPWLHRLFRGRLLGSGQLLRPADQHQFLRCRVQCRPGRLCRSGRRRRRHRHPHRGQRAEKRADAPPGKRGGLIHGRHAERFRPRHLGAAHRRRPGDPDRRPHALRSECGRGRGDPQRGLVTGTMWRGLEVILKGRDPRDAWAFTERICGVCTGTHALTSRPRGRGCAGHHHPRQRQLDPQPDAAEPAGARPYRAFLSPARA
jgi:hydrogenase small subunit